MPCRLWQVAHPLAGVKRHRDHSHSHSSVWTDWSLDMSLLEKKRIFDFKRTIFAFSVFLLICPMSHVSLRSLWAYFVSKTEPKILCLVNWNPPLEADGSCAFWDFMWKLLLLFNFILLELLNNFLIFCIQILWEISNTICHTTRSTFHHFTLKESYF